jgi:hypothetical protein
VALPQLVWRTNRVLHVRFAPSAAAHAMAQARAPPGA